MKFAIVLTAAALTALASTAPASAAYDGANTNGQHRTWNGTRTNTGQTGVRNPTNSSAHATQSPVQVRVPAPAPVIVAAPPRPVVRGVYEEHDRRHDDKGYNGHRNSWRHGMFRRYDRYDDGFRAAPSHGHRRIWWSRWW